MIGRVYWTKTLRRKGPSINEPSGRMGFFRVGLELGIFIGDFFHEGFFLEVSSEGFFLAFVSLQI